MNLNYLYEKNGLHIIFKTDDLRSVFYWIKDVFLR